MSSEVWAFAPSMVQCGPAGDRTLLNTASICTTVPTTIHLRRPAGSIRILYDPQPTPVPQVQLNNPFPTHPHTPPLPPAPRAGSIKIVYDPQPTPKAVSELLGTKIKQVGAGEGMRGERGGYILCGRGGLGNCGFGTGLVASFVAELLATNIKQVGAALGRVGGGERGGGGGGGLKRPSAHPQGGV